MNKISKGMSRAYKARMTVCPLCGKKTVRSKVLGFHCRWCGFEDAQALANRSPFGARRGGGLRYGT